MRVLPCEYSDSGFKAHEFLGKTAIERPLCHDLLMESEVQVGQNDGSH